MSKKNIGRESGALLLLFAISSSERKRFDSCRAKGEVNQRRDSVLESRNGERGLKDIFLDILLEGEGVESRVEFKSN